MREIISKAASSGLDFTRRGALKSFLSKIDIDPESYDIAFTIIKNSAYERDFARIPYCDRIVFLPHCMKNIEGCKAKLTEDGLRCLRCGKCGIGEIFELAEDLGYRGVYVAPGSSLVKKLILREKPRAVLGVACYLELAEAMEHISLLGTIPQGVPLVKDGCVNTMVDISRVKQVMRKLID